MNLEPGFQLSEYEPTNPVFKRKPTASIETLEQKSATKDSQEIKLPISKKFLNISMIISLLGIIAISLLINLSIDSSEVIITQNLSAGDLYILNYTSRTVVTTSQNDSSNVTQEVAGNSTFTVLVLGLKDGNLSFIFAEGNYSSNFSNRLNENQIDIFGINKYFLVDSDYQSGEITRIRFLNFMTINYVESIIPFIKGFLVNYNKINNEENGENEEKTWKKSFTKSESLTENNNFYIFRQNFINKESLQARVTSDDYSKKGYLKNIEAENWINQYIDKKTMKLSMTESYLRADLKMFNSEEKFDRFEVYSEVQIYEEKFKISKNFIKILVNNIVQGNFSVLEESDQENESEGENRSLQTNFVKVAEKPLLDVFGKKLNTIYIVSNSSNNFTISKILKFEGFFEKEICKGLLHEEASSKIKNFITLKNLYESQSDLIKKSVLALSSNIKNSANLLKQLYSKISMTRINFEYEKNNVKTRIDTFLNDINKNYTINSENASSYESRRIEFEMFEDDLFDSFLELYDILTIDILDKHKSMDLFKSNALNNVIDINKKSEALIEIKNNINTKKKINSLNKDVPLNDFMNFYKRRIESDDLLREAENDYNFTQEILSNEKNNLTKDSEDFYNFLLESLRNCCQLMNKFEIENKLLQTECEDALMIIDEEQYLNKLELFALSLENINPKEEMLKNIKNSNFTLQQYLTPTFIKNQNLVEDFLTIKNYFMNCEGSSSQTFQVNIQFPYESSITVPITVNVSTMNQNMLSTNNISTLGNSMIEESISLKYSGSVSKGDYEVIVNHDALILLSILYQIGYSFTLFNFIHNGTQISKTVRNLSIRYKKILRSSHEHCWFDACRGNRCETHYESYWSDYQYSTEPTFSSNSEEWLFFPYGQLTAI